MEIDASIVLDELVHQFADPMAFFRELIQNALDAGTGEIDVTIDWEPSDREDDLGQMTVGIRDYGVGMDRQIIENELLELFNSGKDRDLTKIGRFGIGFVSVFAVEPDAVCVDTGRAGESWRLLFDSDRSYELFDRDIPFEGTSVRLFKALSQADYIAFQDRAREAIFEWCKHIEQPLHFNDEPLGADFDIESPCKTTLETEGTRIVAGYVRDKKAPFGYYHSGLTLMEGKEGPWSHVSFKLDSRYLEHTVTRDQIIEDKNFRKALQLLEQVIEERLPSLLASKLEEAAADNDLETAETLARVAMWRPPESSFWDHFWGKRGLLKRGEERSRPLFPLFDEPPATVSHISSETVVLWSDERTPIVDHLPHDALVLASPDGNLVSLASALTKRELPNANRTYFFVRAEPAARAAEDSLAVAIAALFGRANRLGVSFGTIHSESPAANRPWIAVDNTDTSRPIESLPPTSVETLRRAEHVVLNRQNPLVETLLARAERRPQWAALMLVMLSCPDATSDDPGADQLLRTAYRLDLEAP
jgi:hypothetical protein